MNIKVQDTEFQGSDTQKVHPPKNPAKNLAKKPGKTHLKPNGIVFFNNTFCYFEVLKPISRTLLDIFTFRYSNVVVSILRTKPRKGWHWTTETDTVYVLTNIPVATEAAAASDKSVRQLPQGVDVGVDLN